MVSEQIHLEGHLIDSMILSRILDEIVASGGDFKLTQVAIGQTRDDLSSAEIQVAAADADRLSELIGRLARLGATVSTPQDAKLAPAEQDGIFPEGFYSTTNQKTLIRRDGHWIEVDRQEMDCGIRFDESRRSFTCVPVCHAHKGDRFVIGHQGVKVIPQERSRQAGGFEFMSSSVSTEKPKNVIIATVARRMREAKQAGKKILLVAGPAIVHTGSARHVIKLIENGYVHILFAGNALATHDIEQALYGTSLGVYMDRATPAEAGHEHHLRAINMIRRCGSIPAAVENGVLKAGIVHACVRHGVEVLLAGSIRDDGPLPGVVTDAVEAQDKMRDYVQRGDIGFALMAATLLHSVATGNLLPADIPVVCVDISPAAVTKLADRGSWQTVGVVTDVEPFFRELLTNLDLDGA